jgi:hypothetical protein
VSPDIGGAHPLKREHHTPFWSCSKTQFIWDRPDGWQVVESYLDGLPAGVPEPANPKGIGNNSLRLPNLGEEAAHYVASLRPTLSRPNSFFNLHYRVFTPLTRWMIVG